jgi:glycerol kinase
VLGPAIVWQCRRGDALCAAHAAAGQEPMLHEKTGLMLDAYFSGSKLQWLVRHQPGLRAQLAAGSALIGTIDAYVIYRRTAGNVFTTDSTNTSRTLHFDLGRLRWDEELCVLWEVPLRALHGDGGPTASEFLMQFTADVTGAELRVATLADCSPLGAVLAGQLGLGFRRSFMRGGRPPCIRCWLDRGTASARTMLTIVINFRPDVPKNEHLSLCGAWPNSN